MYYKPIPKILHVKTLQNLWDTIYISSIVKQLELGSLCNFEARFSFMIINAFL